MNLSTKKKLLKATLILQIIILCLYSISFIYMLSYSNFIIEYYEVLYEIKIGLLFYFFTILFMLLTYTFMILLIQFIKIKMSQNKIDFYQNIKNFRIISIFFIILVPITGILLTIISFTKDDGFEEKNNIKNNKKEITIPSSARMEIKKLQKLRKKGFISQELYDKKYNSIVKKIKTTHN